MQQILDARRRSSRVPVSFPVLVTTLNPEVHFSEICETLVVSAHGCAIRSPLRLEKGAPIHLHSEEGRQTRAQVVSCQRLGSDQKGWVLGASLEQPQNFWGLKSFPKDWGLQLPAPAQPPAAKLAARSGADPAAPDGFSVREYLDIIQRQVSDERLQERLTCIVHPLKAELAELKEKFNEGKRSRFEVSLSHIPPELQEQLWLRLRKDLGAQVLRQTLEQSEQVLGAARESIDQKITEAQEQFSEHLARELQGFEERMRSVLADSAARVRHHIGAGLEQFQHHATEAGNALEQKSEEMLRSLTQRLTEEHESQRWKTEQLQKALAEESLHLQAQIADLRDRVGRLDEVARHLETGFERRLQQTATEIASAAHAQLESAVQTLLTEAETRNAKELGDQLDQAYEHLKMMQKGAETSLSDALKARTAEGLKAFEQSLAGQASESIQKFRDRVVSAFNRGAEMLGEQLTADAPIGRS